MQYGCVSMLFCIALVLISPARSHKIEHVVVAMLENRAFDHMLGWMALGGPHGDTRIDGLRGNECNALNLTNSSEGRYCVNDEALDHCPYDPNHSFAATTERIFGCEYGKSKGTPCTDIAAVNGTNDMSGFVDSARRQGMRTAATCVPNPDASSSPHYKGPCDDGPTHQWMACGKYSNSQGSCVNQTFGCCKWGQAMDGRNEMTMWKPEKIPILTTLAKEYALFDRFFASHPGSTYPNRQFVLSGTAHGMTDTGNTVPKGGFPQKTVLRSYEEAGLSWRMYYEDSLAWAIFMADVQRKSSKPHIREMEQFYHDAAAGTLANFTFIEPRISPNPAARHLPSFGLANHQHPTASVREGERWMKNIYEAVRRGPAWEKTLLILTYDEHGGFYDHVGVPSPDGLCTKEGFEYKRLGVRIPTVVISPYVAKGTLVTYAPQAQKPTNSSEYELSSIPATLGKLFPQLGADALTRRTAWASTFEHLLESDRPRQDCPSELPEVPPPPVGELERQLARPIDEHAEGVMRSLCQLVGSGDSRCGEGVRTYDEFAPWVTAMWRKWMAM